MSSWGFVWSILLGGGILKVLNHGDYFGNTADHCRSHIMPYSLLIINVSKTKKLL